MMLRHWIALLALAGLSLGLAAEPVTVSLRITDSNTGKPAANAQILVNAGAAAEPSSADMMQENRQFQPQILVVATGSPVNFPNRDSTQHHVYSFSPAKVFNLELFADQPQAPVVFDNSGVVEVGCNIHDQMQGFILVTDSALTAQTDASGIAQIALPAEIVGAGELRLSLWHQRLENTTETIDFRVDLPASGPVELALDLAPERRPAGRLDGLQKRFQDL